MTCPPSHLFRAAVLLTLGVLAPCTPSQAQGKSNSKRPDLKLVQTPDGNRFLLSPVKGLGIIYWSVLVPASVQEDPNGYEGLALAVARAALSGTLDHGSVDRAKETRTLERIDRLEAKLRRAKDKVRDDLLTNIVKARQDASQLGDPLAWELALRRAPSSGSRLVELPDGSIVLQVSTTPSGLAQVANLLRSQREDALLRRVEDQYEQIRIQRGHKLTARENLRRDLLQQVYGSQSYGRFYEQGGEAPSRQLAMRVYKRTHANARGRHVICGDFDMDRMEELLRSAFKNIGQSTPPGSYRRPSSDPRERVPRDASLTHPITGEKLLLLGCWPPQRFDVPAMDVLVTWLGNKDGPLVTGLRKAGHGEVTLKMGVPFPGPGGLLLTEVQAPQDGGDSKGLGQDLLDILAATLENGPQRADLEQAWRELQSRRDRARQDPAAWSIFLARRWLLNRNPLHILRNTAPRLKTVQRLGKKVFSRENRNWAPRTGLDLDKSDQKTEKQVK